MILKISREIKEINYIKDTEYIRKGYEGYLESLNNISDIKDKSDIKDIMLIQDAGSLRIQGGI